MSALLAGAVMAALAVPAKAQLQFELLGKQGLPEREDHTRATVLGDVDGDGDRDLVVGNIVQQSRLYLNDGAGTFTDVTATHMPVGIYYTTSLALGDVDGDGDLDLVVGNSGYQSRLYLNDGTGNFTDATAARMPVGTFGTEASALVDVDGDGDRDLVLGNSNQQIRLYLNNGTGTFTDATGPRMPAGVHNVRSLASGDVDADGDIDLIIGNANQQCLLYLNNGSGTFTDATATRMPVGTYRTTSLAVGDVDGDGDRDLILGNAGVQSRLYLNDGSGTFTDATATRMPVGNHYTSALALGDVDGDGDLDLSVANGAYIRDRQNLLYLNNGTGTFSDATTTRMPIGNSVTRSLVFGDVDGDGDLDQICGNDLEQNRLYLNNGQGTFADATATRMPVGIWDTRSLVFGDVDADGDQDMVLGNAFQQVLLYLNDGTGSFTDATATRMPVGILNATAMSIGDVDGDTDLDLVVGNSGGQSRLYLNNGLGTFIDATATRMPVGNFYTRSLGIGDVDGDGDLDLVLGNTTQQIRLYRNNGTGTFSDVTTGRMPVGGFTTLALALGDIDGDGDRDLVVGNYGEPSLLYLNNGSGTFSNAAAGRMPTGSYTTTSLAEGDVDGDGDFDLVVGNGTFTGQSRLYLNNGTGAFTEATATRMPIGYRDTQALALGDVDTDGDLDLILGNSAQQSVLYLNDGNGAFGDVTATRMPVGSNYTAAVGLVDLDGDDDLDLVLGNDFDTQSRLYFNSRRQLAAPRVVRVGRPYSLDAYVRHGAASTFDLAAVYLSLAPASPSIPLPPFGSLRIDLAQAAPFPLLVVPQPAGIGSVSFTVPNQPSLVGIPLYSQALLGGFPNDLHLSSVVRDVIL